ncbi:hypothetical protein [Kangiella sp. M94]
MEYSFKYVSTHKDLIDSYNAVRNASSGLSGWSRGLILLLGLMWLLGFIFLAPRANNIWQPLVWLGLGIFIVWKIAIKPHLEKKYIKETNESEQEVNLEINDVEIKATYPSGEYLSRKWEELEAFQGFKKGVLMGFSDGTLTWLPLRVFNGKKEKNKFINSVILKLREYEAP